MSIPKRLITELAENAVQLSDGLTWDDVPRIHEAIGYALEAYEAQRQAEPIMEVRARTCGNYDPIVGYATGREHDIEAYFDDVKQYGLTIVPIQVVAVPSGYKAHRDNIIAKRDRLQAELDELNARLKSGKIDK